MVDKRKKDNISKLSFEDAIKELTSIVGKIEQGEIPLQDSLTQYERGMSLIQHCQAILKKAEKRIEKISQPDTKSQEEPEAKKQEDAEDLPF